MPILSTKQTAYDVSIIIPIYNGNALLEKHVLPFLGYLKYQSFSVQVIISNDGSDDKKPIEDFANQNNIFFTHLHKNLGKGAALRQGFKSAIGEIQIFTDADIPFQYENINNMVNALQTQPNQFIIGDRKNPRSVYFEKSSGLRNAGSSLVSALVSNLFVKGVHDTQCGLKGMGKMVADKLFESATINRFAIDVELIYLAAKFKVPITKIPVQLRYNDRSSVRVVKDGMQLLQDLYRIKKIHGKL